MEWFFVAKEKRSKKTGTDRLLQKSYQQVFYRFSLFSSDSFKGFFGSINGILFH
ncbi:MAG: hypothetical protein ACLVL2_00765 [Bacteroides cellulosilyticus]